MVRSAYAHFVSGGTGVLSRNGLPIHWTVSSAPPPAWMNGDDAWEEIPADLPAATLEAFRLHYERLKRIRRVYMNMQTSVEWSDAQR